MTEKMTYASSGVDIHLEEKAIKALAAGITYKRTGLGAPLTDIGHYAGLISSANMLWDWPQTVLALKCSSPLKCSAGTPWE